MSASVRKLRTPVLASPGQLHDAALNARDDGVRLELQFIHAEITSAIAAFLDNPSSMNLRRLNGHWAHGAHMLAVAARKNRECVRV